VSTPIGNGGISIIRISGNRALEILKKIFKHNSCEFKSHRIYHGFIFDKNKNINLDEVLVSIMLAPRSYTREDIIEINCHGGLICAQEILDLVLQNGARLAEPGEFTKRAFLNGRIDLSQAESVMQIINSQTDLAKQIALEQLDGNLSREINKHMQEILELIGLIEINIDYPEETQENISNSQLKTRLKFIIKSLEKLILNSQTGKIITHGVNIAIIGKPNVGKSCVLNKLTSKQSAIVTNIPGTTRDIICEIINLDGIKIKLSDTAGIHETNNLIEQIGIKKSKECLRDADLILFILDASHEFDHEDKNILDLIKQKTNKKKFLVLLNKIDLEFKFNIKTISEYKFIKISAEKNLGFEKLKKAIKKIILGDNLDKSNQIFVLHARHKLALINSRNNLKLALETLNNNMPQDLISIDLKNAYDSLGEITGVTLDDQVINKIFSKFCVGK